MTVAGYYTDDMTTPLVDTELEAKLSDCTKGEFCAEDGRTIEWFITAHTDPNPPSTGTTANLTVTYGCEVFRLSSHDGWELEPGSGQPENTGQMTTGPRACL